MYICIFVYMYTCVCMYICMYVHLYVCTCVCMHKCTYVHVYICIHVYIYTHIIHTISLSLSLSHTHTHTQNKNSLRCWVFTSTVRQHLQSVQVPIPCIGLFMQGSSAMRTRALSPCVLGLFCHAYIALCGSTCKVYRYLSLA